MPTELTRPEKKTRDIYDRQAGRYVAVWTEIAGSGLGAPSPIKDKFVELLPSGRILDIGAGGTGRAASWFLDHGYDYVGVDISRGMIEQAQKNCPQARFEQASVYDLDFPGAFDGFWCSAVLLHIPKDRLGAALAAIKGNMKSGAYGFISVKEGEGEVIETDGRFHAYWSQEDFQKRLIGGGYSVVDRARGRIGRIDWLDFVVRVGKPQKLKPAGPKSTS